MNTKAQILIKKSFVLALILLLFRCAGPSDDFTEFPWPPPEPSAFKEITTKLVKKSQDQITLLKDVDEILRQALDESGYAEKSYFAVPGGFALVTRLEQINPDGTPKAAPDRWALEVAPLRRFSLSEYLNALFFANPGLFRIVVFVITPHPFSRSEEIVDRDTAISWLRRGLNVLPSSVANQEYTNEFKTTALIYEFKKLESKEPTLSLPSNLNGEEHLVRAGLIKQLED